MRPWWWISFRLLLLLPAVVGAQSGDGAADDGTRLSCTSHIMKDGSSLTCRLRGRGSDDEDEDIDRITACFTDWSSSTLECLENDGDTLRSSDLNPVVHLNVTVHLSSGGSIRTMVDLMKIVKPWSPQVWNVSFLRDLDEVLVHLRTPYHRDYLREDNQLFQALLWNLSCVMTLNSSSLDLTLDSRHLRGGVQYQVKVRSIPQTFLQGTWSEWSETFSFVTPPGRTEEVQKLPEELQAALVLVLVLLLVLLFILLLFCRNRISTLMCPHIPDPKHTLVHICKPNKILLLNFKPEVFSSLNVHPVEKTEAPTCAAEGPEWSPAPSPAPSPAHSSRSSSAHSSRSSTGVGDEEQEAAALLSSSSRAEAPEPEGGAAGSQVERRGPQDEAYVTMSSFYQIKATVEKSA